MKRFLYLCSVTALLLGGCAHAGKPVAVQSYPFSFTEVSQGLPAEGMWRQHIALHDMNSDGMLDIVVPPSRKSGDQYYMPVIFLYAAAGGGWEKATFDFPPLNEYGYGSVAVRDLDNDGNPDIALAVHTGNVVILRNSGEGSFARMPFHYAFPFSSRAIASDDLDGDGRPDIIAFAEVSARKKSDRPKVGLLLGMNRAGNEWEARAVEASRGISGDSVATGDVNGDGAKDILIAPLTNIKENKKIVWFNDGKGEFAAYKGDLAGDLLPSVVQAGDIDGDGKDEVIIIMSGSDFLTPKYFVYTFMWDGSAFSETSSRMEFEEAPAAMDVVDIDGDNRKEVIVLCKGGIDIFQYTESGWSKAGHQKLPAKESVGVYDLRAGVNRDGSVLVVYNLGNEPNAKAWNNGLRAYLVKPGSRN